MIKLLQLMINNKCELLTNVSTNHIADSQVGKMMVKVMRKHPGVSIMIGKVEIYTKENLHVAGAPWC